jgi:ubiquinone/menaquinone biosynthesis C-methylase UbiE
MLIMNHQPGYLSYQFEDTPDTVNSFDELPLWSAAFGLLMLKHLSFARGMKVVDAGSGTGFPLLNWHLGLATPSACMGLTPG